MTDKTLLDGNGAPFTYSLNLALGPQSDANSKSVTLATIPAAALGAAGDAAWVSGSGSLVALLKTIATGISTIDGRVDGLETLIGTTNATLSTTNSTLTTIDGRVDGLEALIGTTNTTLGTIDASLNDIEAVAEDTTTPSLVKIDQTTPGTTNGVSVNNSPAANTAKTYTGTFVVAATALTRPANTIAYTALDSISDNATAGSVTANSASLSDTNDHPIDLSEILIDTTDTGPGTAAIQIRLHLFNSNPTLSSGVVGGDNAAWSNKKAGWIGSFSGTMRAFSDGSRGVLIADEGTLRLTAPVSGAKTLYWQIQTLGAFTPSANSTTFTPTFKGFQARAA